MDLWLWIIIYFQSQIKLVYICICFGIGKKNKNNCCFFSFLPYVHTVRIREGAWVSCWVIPTWAYPPTAVGSTLEHYWPPSQQWIEIRFGYNHLPGATGEPRCLFSMLSRGARWLSLVAVRPQLMLISVPILSLCKLWWSLGPILLHRYLILFSCFT